MAKMKFKWGVMNSGKSQELIRTVYNYKSKEQDVLVLVPEVDDRFGVGKVTSRTGTSIEATPVGSVDELNAIYHQMILNKNLPACVMIDEVQFFSPEIIKHIKQIFVLDNNISVLAYGLKTDFMNNLFPGSEACLVYSEEIQEIETVCNFCNKKATLNMRLVDGVPAREGEQVQVGDSEYLQVCHKHWNDPFSGVC